MPRFLPETMRRDVLSLDSLESRYVSVAEEFPAADAIYEHAWNQSLEYAHHGLELTGRGQTIVVIDSGIAYDHPALGGGFGIDHRVVGGWDFSEENDANPYDDGPAGFHGTHVAGILASQDSRHQGVAPDVQLVALRVFNDQGKSDFRWVERALQWVLDHENDFGAPITGVNLSLSATRVTSQVDANLLEDEFRALAERQIFVAVAAGNGFDDDGRASPDFPAASPWVVPVGSVAGDGSVSDFSRRDSRILFGLGEDIVSTVTDHFDNFNRKPDDYFAFSGTSQATPQVLGAATLVREALQRAGERAITTQRIIDVLRRTSDRVFDPATQQDYARINLTQALDFVLPDDAGDEGASAKSVAWNGGETRWSGQINHPADHDVYRIVATASGVFSLDVTSSFTGQVLPAILSIDGTRQATQAFYSVRAGQELQIDVGADTLVSYDAVVQFWPTREEVGGAFGEQRVALAAHQTNVYTWTAPRSGWVAWEIFAGNFAGQTPLWIENQRLQRPEKTASGSHRLDRFVDQGTQIDWVFTSPHAVEFDWTFAQVESTAQADWHYLSLPDQAAAVSIEVGTHLRLQVGRVAYDFPLLPAASWQIDARTSPQVFCRDDRAGTSFQVRAGRADLVHDQNRITVQYATQLDLEGNPGNGQELRLYGSAADESLRGEGGTRWWRGPTQRVSAAQFDAVRAFSGGGQDTVEWLGDDRADTLVIRDDSVRWTRADGVDVVAGFAQVVMDANVGEVDRVTLYDTAGDDRIVVTDQRVRWTTPGRFWLAQGFEKIVAHSLGAGTDQVHLQGARPTIGSSRWRAWLV